MVTTTSGHRSWPALARDPAQIYRFFVRCQNNSLGRAAGWTDYRTASVLMSLSLVTGLRVTRAEMIGPGGDGTRSLAEDGWQVTCQSEHDHGDTRPD